MRPLSSRTSRLARLFLLVVFVSLWSSVAHAQCPTGQFYLDLKTCTTAGLTGVSFLPGGACQALNPVPSGCAPAVWKEAAIQIDIPAACRQANVVVEWEGLPNGFTVNLGDSSTNDAFAGGAGGSTLNCAEAWVLGENLSVATNCIQPPAILNPVATAHLSLTDAAIKFVVRDQFLSWGNPYTFLNMAPSKQLFAIPDTVGPNADGRKIYLGLNRVITGRTDRNGCGARRVLVSYQ